MAKHVMIDLETYSTRSNAAIVSIGACTFHLDGSGVHEAGEHESFIVGINPESYDSIPTTTFHEDARTIAWWAKQPKAARDSLKINLVQTLPLAMDKLYAWFEDVGFIKSSSPYSVTDSKVWANPTSFDLVILQNAAVFTYGDADQLPWHFRQEMCGRTHSALFRQLRDQAYRSGAIGEGLIKHRADHDAIRQARFVQYIEARRTK